MFEDQTPLSLNGLIAAVSAVLAVQELLIWAYKTWRDRDRDDG